MADPVFYPFDAHTKVYWVTTIASIAAPTTTELNAGTDISCYLTKDGLDTGVSESAVDGSTLCSTIDGETAGTSKYSPTLKMYRATVDADDDAWNLVSLGTAGYLVVRRAIANSTAWTAAQKVEVYQGQFGNPMPAASAANANVTFTAKVYVSAVNLKATVAAGA